MRVTRPRSEKKLISQVFFTEIPLNLVSPSKVKPLSSQHYETFAIGKKAGQGATILLIEGSETEKQLTLQNYSTFQWLLYMQYFKLKQNIF